MSFKEFSSAHNPWTKGKPKAQSEDAPVADLPVPEPNKKPATVAPTSKT